MMAVEHLVQQVQQRHQTLVPVFRYLKCDEMRDIPWQKSGLRLSTRRLGFKTW